MSKTKTPEFLRLQAETIRCTLPDLCRNDGWSMNKVRRVASAIIHEEDLKGKPAESLIPSVKAAMRMLRLERKADEPDYPESAKRQYLEQNKKFEKFMADTEAKKKRKQ